MKPVDESGRLKAAIDDNDAARVAALMTANPSLHRIPITTDGDLALSYAARCLAPHDCAQLSADRREALVRARLAIAEWMLDNGSDVHQAGEAPVMAAAAQRGVRMVDLLVARGANLNVEAWGWFPLIFFPCENVDPIVLKCLLDNGADPNCAPSPRRGPGTALDYVISTYVRRQHDLTACIDLLLAAGANTRFDVPVVMDLLRNRLDQFAERVAADPALVHSRFPQLEFGATGGRVLTLRGATLLHVAAEYQNLDATRLLLDRGADVNARAAVDEHGVGGQTPIFHSATQFDDNGLPVTRLLVERRADLTVRAKVPGHYERSGEIVECTALGYALHLEEVTRKPKTLAFLREHGAAE